MKKNFRQQRLNAMAPPRRLAANVMCNARLKKICELPKVGYKKIRRSNDFRRIKKKNIG